MAELSDIQNQTIQDEIEEYLERADEIERFTELFARVKPAMQDIAAAIIEGDDDEVDALTAKALENGIDAIEIMDDGLIAGMGIVGIKFRENFVFVPEVLSCARAMRAGMAHIEPILSASGIESQGKVIMGTVKGDLHDIGKNLVVLLLESSGFEVINIGENVDPQQFVEKARKLNADVVGMSSLLTTGDPHIKSTIEAFKDSDLAGKVKLLCGGAAVTKKFAVDECGADAYATDAVDAVRVVKQLLAIAA